MKKCLQCSAKFKWKEVYYATLFGERPLICKQCGKIHKIKFSSRLVWLVFILAPYLPVWIIGPHYVMEHVGKKFIWYYITWIIIALFLSPILYRYHIEEDKDRNKIVK
jgi:hypothetical protein